MKYDKLVRDKIPQLIADDGKTAIFRIASKSELREYLEKKLHEEVAEYCESNGLDELADVYEVLAALAKLEGSSLFGLNEKANHKRLISGAFDNNIILLEVGDG